MASLCDRFICCCAPVLGAVLCAFLIWSSWTPTVGWAQAVAPGLQQQVERDLRGEDRQGKDGPLAKVGSQLALMYRAFEQHQQAKAGQPFRPDWYARSVVDEHVAIDAIAARDVRSLRMDLEQLGLRRAATAGAIVSGYLPVRAIPEAAQLATLRSAQIAVARLRAGAATTQGDAAMRADVARSQEGVTGDGITVGVLSDSYNINPDAATSALDDVNSGDLPSPDRITILQDAENGSDEGRAMMQIVHDVAQGADLAFHTALGGQANFAQGIRDLAVAGSNVIVDDIFYFNEPMFQDGVIAQAIDEVVASGVSYFTAAGNSARESYASTFNASGELGPGNGVLHAFSPGDTRQQITIPEDDSITISFQWTDPYASAGGEGANSDLDLYLLDQRGNEVASSISDNNGGSGQGGGDPVEFIQYKNDGSVDANGDGTPDEQFDLAIERVDGPAPERIKYIYFPGDADPEDGPTVSIDEHMTGSPTIFGHSNAAGAATTGAVFWFATPAFSDAFSNPFAVNAFSSVGGVPIYFRPDGTPLVTPEVRPKPDVVGPDGGNNTFFGQELNDGDDFPNFFGTSAAAPHVAAVAALMLAFDPARAPAQIYADLEETAVDMTQVLVDGVAEPIPDGAGFDFYSGQGLVQADAAVPLNAQVVRVQADLASGPASVQLQWTETAQANIDRYFVDRRVFDGAFQQITEVPSEGAQTYRFDTEPLGLGVYTFRVRWVTGEGEEGTSPIMPRVTVGLQSFTASFNEEEGDAVDLAWTVPEETTGYRYLVQQRSNGGFTTVLTTTERAAVADNLQPGAYDFRLIMEKVDGSGAFSSVVRSAQVPFEGAIAMGAPYPNPAADVINVPVTLASAQFVTIRVFSALGRLVKIRGEQLDSNVPSTITIEPGDTWSSGVYFIRVDGDDFSETRQAVLVR